MIVELNARPKPQAPDSHGDKSLVMGCDEGWLSMSIEGFDAEPDDWGCGVDFHVSDNDNERPFAWRDRRPTF